VCKVLFSRFKTVPRVRFYLTDSRLMQGIIFQAHGRVHCRVKGKVLLPRCNEALRAKIRAARYSFRVLARY
jgi:hypothetical protein